MGFVSSHFLCSLRLLSSTTSTGESWSFVQAQRQDRGGEWIQKRVAANGPVFKTPLMGSPTVVVTGQMGNKFVFSAKDEQPPSIVRLSGKSNIFELTGARIERHMQPILRARKGHLIEGVVSAKDDIVSCPLSLRDQNGVPIPEEEVVDNFVTLMIASHNTSAILLSLMVWKLAQDPKIYQKILKEQMNILQEKESHGKLAWSEVQKMKYRWRVAQELMRMIPPLFGSFRKALKDISFGSYNIPKGWQVFWEASGTHMDKDIFEDPIKFDPSRFENPSKPVPAFTYIPFGTGSCMCIGNEFARVEALTVMYTITLISDSTILTKSLFL